MRFPLLAFFVFFAAQLFAQPSLRDTVRPGMKSVTQMICGYGENGDSTGLMVCSEKRYDAAGNMLFLKDCRMGVRIAATTPSYQSWFFKMHAMIPDSQMYYTMSYKYESGKPVEIRTGSKKEMLKYNRKGKLVSSWTVDTITMTTIGNRRYKYRRRSCTGTLLLAGREFPMFEERYDKEGRLEQRIVSFRDTTYYTYKADGKTELRSESYHFTRTTYDQNDSLVSRALYRKDNGNPGLLSDSIFFARDASGKAISAYHEGHFYRNHDTHEEGRVNDSIVVQSTRYENGKPVEFTEQSGNEVDCKRYWFYNAQGELAEMRLYNGNGQLVQRDVYTYTYY